LPDAVTAAIIPGSKAMKRAKPTEWAVGLGVQFNKIYPAILGG
jgi:hypothetical protein